MRPLFLILLPSLLGLSACVSVAPPNPCYDAARLISTEATGDEIVVAANRCLTEGADPAQGYIVRSAGHLRAERYTAAIADADAAIGVEPKYPDAWYYRGFANEKSGNLADARRDFDKAAELGLAPAFALRERGRLRFLTGDYLDAYADFTALVEANDADQEAWRLRGATAAVLERFPRAEADLNRAIELDPEDLRAYSARGYVRYLTGRYAEAAADLRLALRVKPEGLKTAFLYLAMRAARDPAALGELRQRTALLDTAIYPGVFPAFFLETMSIAEMIEITERTGTHSEAENHSEAYFYAGQMELFRGNIAAARTWFQKVLATGVVRFDEVRAARKELRALGVSVPSPDPEAGLRAPGS